MFTRPVWYDSDDALSSECIDEVGFHCTVANVTYAAEGEAEGGLGALLRFMGSLYGVELPPRSPAGFYLSSQTGEGGRWEVSGPFRSLALAKAALFD